MTPIAVKTKFRSFLYGPVAKSQDLSNSTSICNSLKCITEIPNNEREKIKKFWEIESFESKTTNDIVYDNFFSDVSFTEGESRYKV